MTKAENLGVLFERRGALVDAALDVVSALWTGEEVPHEGEFFSLEDASIGFEPCGDLPVYVASGFDPDRGFPRPILNRVAALGDGWFPTRMLPASFETGFERVREAVADAGRDPGAVEGAYYLNAIVDDLREATLDRAVAFHEAYYPGWEKPRKKLASEGAYGTPEEVADRLDAYRDAGVEPFVVRFPTANQREQLRRFLEML